MIDHRAALKADMLESMVAEGHARCYVENEQSINAVVDFLFDNGFWRTFSLLLIIAVLKFDMWAFGGEWQE